MQEPVPAATPSSPSRKLVPAPFPGWNGRQCQLLRVELHGPPPGVPLDQVQGPPLQRERAVAKSVRMT